MKVVLPEPAMPTQIMATGGFWLASEPDAVAAMVASKFCWLVDVRLNRTLLEYFGFTAHGYHAKHFFPPKLPGY